MQLKRLYQGRLSLLGYWLNFLLLGLIIAPLSKLFSAIAQDSLFVRVILGILLIACLISIFIRRSHDLSKSGWIIILLCIPIVDFFVGLYLSFWPGNSEPNQYGSRMKLSNEILPFIELK